jgi:hypothetical protein
MMYFLTLLGASLLGAFVGAAIGYIFVSVWENYFD